MNMQNKLHTIQFSHHLMTDLQPVPEQRSWNAKLTNFWEFRKTPPKKWTPRKVRTCGQDSIWTPRKWEELRASCPLAAPFHKLSVTSVVWNISTGQLGPATWLCSLPAPARLLISWTWEMGRSPWFHSNNWKHQCYQHSSCTKSKLQQLLGGKLTIPAKTRTPAFKPIEA